MNRIEDSATEIATPLTAADVADNLARKIAVPAGTDAATQREGVSILLSRAGNNISAMSTNPKAVIAMLAKIDALAGLGGNLVALWLAIRALNTRTTAQIGISDDLSSDPLTCRLLQASGLVATTDADATVRGVLGPLGKRGIDTLAAGARIVEVMQGNQISVGTAEGRILSADASDASTALGAIDATFQAARKPSVGPIHYNIVDGAEHAGFANALFAPYRVRRIEIPGAHPHPTDLVESAALFSVLPPLPSYRPHLHADVITKGILSEAQLERVIYAGEAHSKYLPSNPDDEKMIAPRQGFLVGDGTGFGKNRVIAAIIADNWVQGRRRHIWLTESARLIEDAREAWVALGGRADDVIDLREIDAKGAIPPMSGIIYATYAALRSESENTSRLQQLINWFGPGDDGCITFDEGQNLRNAKDMNSKAGSHDSDLSQQGLAALDLQNALPNARVVYASATSASDISGLGYAIRLGLWGKGTAFATSAKFFKAMDEGGTNALEMVARDLKAMGLYQAANLSFDGVSYERLNRKLTQAERDAQDRLSEIWIRINEGRKRANIHTGASSIRAATRGLAFVDGSVNFGMTRARFFQALQASLNTPQVIEAIRTDIANGHAAVVQLTNTFEANADRAIAAAEEADLPMDMVEASAKDILKGYVRDHFPIHMVRAVKKGKRYIAELILDHAGNPVPNPQAVAIRDALMAEIDAIEVPEGPLEQIFRAFGTDHVAEITGRSRRIVPGPSGEMIVEERDATANEEEFKAFRDDMKQILVFSRAGGVGATYSAQRTYRNKRLRRHYVLQAGWRADVALQGMGRTHRSNQVQPPEYILVSNDLWASQRMVSAVARGMRDLGAITRGLRQAASQEFFVQDDNLEDEFANDAWVRFLTALAGNHIVGMSLAQFEREACIPLRMKSGVLIKPIPPVRRFLNAMAAMSCSNQALFGQHFREELQQIKLEAIQSGDFDRGIETITPDSLIKLEDQVIYRDPRTGGETRMLKMLSIDALRPVSYHDARRNALGRGTAKVVKSLLTGRIAILCFPRSIRGRMPQLDDKVEVITPTGTRTRTRDEVMQERWLPVEAMMAESLWEAEIAERGTEEERDFWVITGAMLPLWDKLPRHRPTVYRMETDEGEQIIGRLVSEDYVSTLTRRVDALSGGGLPVGDVDAAITAGGVVSLANSWVIQGRISMFTGQLTLTLQIPLEDETGAQSLLHLAQLKRIPGPLTTMAYFRIPEGHPERLSALGHILAHSPAVATAVI